ncbi:MAG TPA: lipocalin-like domain-containing protein [Candidatus Dormibacteraeota bacterium]|jgi:predicted secreted hydrolase|nr:lipocalin-like domain-containing protein [Candidatus Dormibacteraeota bacterium]
MRNRAFCAAFLFATFPMLDVPYRVALPGYRYEFPRDFFAHSSFQTEWWYTTGNVKTPDGRAFGFELTFFRQAVSRDESKHDAWDVKDLYLAHLALSDLDGGRFYQSERVNRTGPGIAGVSAQDGKVWNGNWFALWSKDGTQQLRAQNDDFQFAFSLKSEKLPVIHGENGISQKSEGVGRASHYFSQTRLVTNGTIELKGKRHTVSGLSWMDHEFFTHQLAADQVGWDWFSIQLEDGTELMFFILRRRDGSIDPYSAGTYVDASGKSTHLSAADFSLTPEGAVWKSTATGTTYPIQWRLVVPKLDVALEARTRLPQQELMGGTRLAPSYWEGAVEFTGLRANTSLRGSGYLEMTGYNHPIQLIK